MNKVIKALFKLLFAVGVFVVGFGAGLCVNAFLARGVPIINGGGEIIILIALPVAWVLGYNRGVKNTDKKWRRKYDRKQYRNK